MSKNFDKFTKFGEKYDMAADGVEEDVVAFLKKKFPKAYKGAKKDIMACEEITWQYTLYSIKKKEEIEKMT